MSAEYYDNDEPPSWVKSFDFPLRFTETCDTVRSNNDNAVVQNMKTSVMVKRRGIFLMEHLGSLVPTLVFDPNDIPTRELIGEEVVRSVKVGEPRAAIDPTLRIVDTQDEHEIQLAFPYAIRQALRWEVKEFNIPIKTIDK